MSLRKPLTQEEQSEAIKGILSDAIDAGISYSNEMHWHDALTKALREYEREVDVALNLTDYPPDTKYIRSING